MKKTYNTYKKSGINMAAADKLVSYISKISIKTYKKNTENKSFKNIGSFGSIFDLSSLKMKKGTTFKAHRHIWKSGKKNSIAQESWCVIIGSVKGFFYDLDNTLLHTTNLYVGDVSFTLEGGHNYEILENNTIVYEYKTGPYEGQTLDKVFI